MPGKFWTKKELRNLRRQLNQHQVELKDVEIDGRSLPSIRSQAVRMGLVAPKATRAEWPAAQRRQLRDLKEQGYSAREIYSLALLDGPARTYWAIRKQWGRMKLADRQRARKMRRKKQWQPGEKEEFKRYLREHSSTQTPEQIGKIWKVARSTVARWQVELGVKQPREEVMEMPYSQAKQRRSRHKLRQSSLLNWLKRRQQQESDMLALAEHLRNGERPPNERTCRDCKRSWPIRRQFFHYSEKQTRIGTSRWYSRRCRLCQNARRRENTSQSGSQRTA